MDVLGKLIACVLVVFMIFVNPLQYLLESENAIESSYIQSVAAEFVDEVCNSGKITTESYGRLLTSLSKSGEAFDLEMEHIHQVTGVSSDETSKVNEPLMATKAVASNDASVISLAAPASPSHGHTSDCYGTKSIRVVRKVSGGTIQYYNATTGELLSGITDSDVAWDEASKPIITRKNEIPISSTYYSSGNNTFSLTYNRRHSGKFRIQFSPSLPGNVWIAIKDSLSSNNFLASGYLTADNNYSFSFNSNIYSSPYSVVVTVNGNIPSATRVTLYEEVNYRVIGYTSGMEASQTYNMHWNGNYIETEVSNPHTPIYVLTDSNFINREVDCYYTDTATGATSHVIAGSYGGEGETVSTIPAREGDGTFRIRIYNENDSGEAYRYQYHACIYTYEPPQIEPAYGTYTTSTLVCNQVVKSIQAQVPTQTIKQGDSINTNAVVTYLNGGTEVVACTSSFNTNTIGNNQTATLYYNGYASANDVSLNNKTTFSTTVTVNVQSKKTFSSITVNLSKTTIDLYQAFPITSVTLHYDNGETETVTSGWTVTGFNNTVGGSQTVTVSYTKGTITKSAAVTIFIRKLQSIHANIASTTVPINTDLSITSVILTYNNNTTQTVTSGWSVTGYNKTVGGSQTITVSYTHNGVTASENITIYVRKLTSLHANIANTTIPINTDLYIASVVLTYNNNTTKTVTSGWSISGFNKAVGGSQTVTISYTENGVTVSENVTIYVRKLQSIKANVSSYTVRKYTELPVTSLTLTFNNGGKETVTSGWTYTGYNPNARGVYNVTIYYEAGGVTCSTNVTITVTNLICVCPYCETSYYCDDSDVDNGCPNCRNKIDHLDVNPSFLTVQRGGALDIQVETVYVDGYRGKVTGWTSNFNPNQLGGQVVTIQYQGLQAKITVRVVVRKLCPYCNNYYEYDKESEAACPNCSRQIVSLSATPDNIRVNYGEQLNITVTATYRDGHTQVITNYDSTYDQYTSGIQSVKISSGSIYTMITVEVIKPSITCPICSRQYDGSIYTSGCPYCSKEIVSIHASLINDGTKVQLGSDLILRVVLEYRDNHREAKYSGYTVEGYDCNQMGEQTVRVFYQTHSCTLTIEVVNELMKVVCPNGHVYSLNADRSDPGCPYCVTESANKEMSYLKICYTDEILEKLETDGEYLIPSGDYFSITIRRRETKNSGNPLRQLTSIDVLYVKKEFVSGGEVK